MGSLPDAVFATSDSAAIGIISTLAEAGVKAGEDISVMGFDDNQIAEYYLPPLTTVSQPQLEIGQKAMELLINKIKNLACEDQHLTLPHRLEIRSSVKLAAAAEKGRLS